MENNQLQGSIEYLVNISVLAFKEHRPLLNNRNAPERVLRVSKMEKDELIGGKQSDVKQL
jgi:hypothetical protein